MSTLSEFRQELEQKKGQAKQIFIDLSESRKKIKALNTEIRFSEKAQAVISVVAKITQKELEYKITEPVSLALAAVYGEKAYKMVAEFSITGKGSTECVLGFEKDGMLKNPLEDSGGGPIDIASFALRIGSLSLEATKPRKILLLDEPFKWVDREKMALAGMMLKEISEKLGIQIIMVTHIPELISAGHKVFRVTMNKKISYVEELQQ